MKNMNAMLALIVLAGASMMSCSNEAPAISSALGARVDYFINDGDSSRGQFLQEIRSTSTTIEAAFTSLTDADVANALVIAHKAGAKVRVVGDADFQNDSGFQTLEAEGIAVTYGNGELRYLPDPTLSPIMNTCGYNTTASKVICPGATPFIPLSDGQMVRPGEMNLMSHNFVILGANVVWNFSHPQFGGVRSIPLAFRFESETVKESFWREFNQMHGGVFATTLTVYNGPVKSGTQWHSTYITELGEFGMRFSPQERTVKSMIDDVYRTRGNVYVMADSISEGFLLDALEYKKNAGFDVRIVVREAGQDPDLIGRLQDLEARFTNEDVDYLPTVIAVDTQGTKGDLAEQRRVHVVSHPVFRTGPFRVITAEPNDEVEVYYSDYFTDGVLWSLSERPEQDNPVLDQIERGVLEIWEGGRGVSP